MSSRIVIPLIFALLLVILIPTGIHAQEAITLNMGDLNIPQERLTHPDGTSRWYPPIEPTDTSGWTVVNVGDYMGSCDLGDNTNDDESCVDNAVTAAINADPNGVVLYFPAGTYNFINGQSIKASRSNMVIRCEDPSNTHLKFHSGEEGNCAYGSVSNMCFGAGSDGISVDWTAGFDEDTKVLTVSDTSNINVGDWVIANMGWPGSDCYSDRYGYYNYWMHVFKHFAKVTSKTYNTITIDRPLRMDYTWDPDCGAGSTTTVTVTTLAENLGLEDCHVLRNNRNYASASSYEPMISFSRAAHSWATNNHIEETLTGLNTQHSARILIEGNHFEEINEVLVNTGDDKDYPGDAVNLQWGSDFWVINNIFDRVSNVAYMQMGTEGNVIGHNYHVPGNIGGIWSISHGLYFHGAVKETLGEANDIDAAATLDAYWGPQGPRNTLYRNRMHSVRETHGGEPRKTKQETIWMNTASLNGPFIADQASYIANHADWYIHHSGGTFVPVDGQYQAARDIDGSGTPGYGLSNAHFEFNLAAYYLNLVTPEPTTTCGTGSANDCDEVNNYHGRNIEEVTEVPAAWDSFEIPNSLYLPDIPPWWCQETTDQGGEACPFDQSGIGSFGDKMGTCSSTSSIPCRYDLHCPLGETCEGEDFCKLPAQIRYEGGTCTPIGSTLIADHNAVAAFDDIPQYWIEKAKTDFSMSYGHRSHGSQITSGMHSLAGETPEFTFPCSYYNPTNQLYAACDDYSSALPVDTFSLWQRRIDPANAALDFGTPDFTTWYGRTVTHLNGAGSDRNLVTLSWCDALDGATQSNVNTYLSQMENIEAAFPDVTFIYMTARLDGTGSSGNLHQRNEQIRQYVRDNNKILYDFADVERYDPNGNDYLDQGAGIDAGNGNDGCAYPGGNWCNDWCSTNDCSMMGDCSYSHTSGLNCYMKGKAFWWLLAKIAGWGGSSPPTQECTDDGDCPDDGLWCNGQEICQLSSCTHQFPAGNRDCTNLDLYCDENSDSCVPCSQDSHCDDAKVCTDDVCSSGTCINTNSPAGTPCSGWVCDGLGSCVECLDNSHCNDLNTCNGIETCSGNVCQPGTPPSCGLSDGCCPSGCDSSQDSDCFSDENLVLHYKFDEGSGTIATDSSQSGLTGTLRDGPLWTTGQINGALQFDGVNDNVYIPNGPLNQQVPDGATIMVWANITSYTGSTAFLLDRQYNNIALKLSDTGGLVCQLRSLPTSFNTQSTQAIPIGEWHHMACVYNPQQDELEVYLDGVETLTMDVTGFDEFKEGDTTPFGIGSRPHDVDLAPFHGAIDDVRVYDTSLTAADILSIMSGSPPQSCNTDIDPNCDGCVETHEVEPYIDLWYSDSTLVSMVDLIRALEAWKEPCS